MAKVYIDKDASTDVGNRPSNPTSVDLKHVLDLGAKIIAQQADIEKLRSDLAMISQRLKEWEDTRVVKQEPKSIPLAPQNVVSSAISTEEEILNIGIVDPLEYIRRAKIAQTEIALHHTYLFVVKAKPCISDVDCRNKVLKLLSERSFCDGDDQSLTNQKFCDFFWPTSRAHQERLYKEIQVGESMYLIPVQWREQFKKSNAQILPIDTRVEIKRVYDDGTIVPQSALRNCVWMKQRDWVELVKLVGLKGFPIIRRMNYNMTVDRILNEATIYVLNPNIHSQWRDGLYQKVESQRACKVFGFKLPYSKDHETVSDFVSRAHRTYLDLTDPEVDMRMLVLNGDKSTEYEFGLGSKYVKNTIDSKRSVLIEVWDFDARKFWSEQHKNVGYLLFSSFDLKELELVFDGAASYDDVYE
jgi:hypothetical protein